MRAAEIAPAHYLGHLGLPSYPRPAVGLKFKGGGKVCTFPKFQKSASHLLFKKAKNKRVPDRNMVPPTCPIPHSYSLGAKTTSPPAAKPRRPPSATPSHPSTAALLHHAGADTPTSPSTTTSTPTPPTASS